MPKTLIRILRLALTAACLVYALWGIDLQALSRVLGQLSAITLALLFLLGLAQYVPPAIRLSYLSSGKIGVWTGYVVNLFCLGVNTILPAKLGEVAKIVYLHRNESMSVEESCGLTFWERFSDLNAILLFALYALLAVGGGVSFLPLFALVAGIWIFLALAWRFPGMTEFFAKFVPTARAKRFFLSIMSQLQTMAGPSLLLNLSLLTALTWIVNTLFTFLLFNWLFDLNLSLGQMVTVYTVSILGYIIPSAPGALGVFEASLVLSLGWFGVNKEESVALAVIIRLLQTIPSLAMTMYVLMTSDMTLKRIQEETLQEQTENPVQADEQ